MRRVVVAAHKGGSGKTTVAVNLAGALAALGKSVLLVDTDPQGAASAALGVEPGKPTLYEALTGQVHPREAIVGTPIPGLSMVPSDLDLAGAEVELPTQPGWQRALDGLMAAVEATCDVVIIDTPPGLGVLSLCALTTGTETLVVCPPEFLAFRSLPHLDEMAQRVDAPVTGIIPTMSTQATRHAREVTEMLGEQYAAILLPAVPRRVVLQDAALAGQPITTYAPNSDAASVFHKIAKEVLIRATTVAA